MLPGLTTWTRQPVLQATKTLGPKGSAKGIVRVGIPLDRTHLVRRKLPHPLPLDLGAPHVEGLLQTWEERVMKGEEEGREVLAREEEERWLCGKGEVVRNTVSVPARQARVVMVIANLSTR